jgi:hypothetical protein
MRPLPDGWEVETPADHSSASLAIPPVLFEHHAIVYSADGKPISEVEEHYTSAILDFHRAQ